MTGSPDTRTLVAGELPLSGQRWQVREYHGTKMRPKFLANEKPDLVELPSSSSYPVVSADSREELEVRIAAAELVVKWLKPGVPFDIYISSENLEEPCG